MSWYWQPDGSSVSTSAAAGLGLDQRFPTQGDAESWLGEFYPDLQQAGIHAVSLYEETRLVYGPMQLEP